MCVVRLLLVPFFDTMEHVNDGNVSHRILTEIYKMQLRLDSIETKITNIETVYERLRKEAAEMSSFGQTRFIPGSSDSDEDGGPWAVNEEEEEERRTRLCCC